MTPYGRLVLQNLSIDEATEQRWASMPSAEATAGAGEVMLTGPIVNPMQAAMVKEATGVEPATPSAFKAALADVDGDVTVRVNSPGGDWFQASEIHAALVERRAAGDTVRVVIDGVAASAAALIAMESDDIRIAPMGALMVHKSWVAIIGNADGLRVEAKRMDKMDEVQVELLTPRLAEGVDAMELLAAETWYTADEAVKAGLVDGKMEARGKNKHRTTARAARSRAMLAGMENYA